MLIRNGVEVEEQRIIENYPIPYNLEEQWRI